MNLEELSHMAIAELRERANERLAPRSMQGPGGIEIAIKPDLSDAQFFIDEIERRIAEAERRKQSRIGVRDFILELIVIILIGLELYFGIVGGNKQLAVLQTLKTSADQQVGVLQNLNTSAGETARIMKSLREEQDIVLATQQQTLQLTGQINGALQTQLGLNFAPALTLAYDEPHKSLTFLNFGKTEVFVWGSKDIGKLDMLPEPRIIVGGGSYTVPEDDLLKTESQRVPKGSSETLPYDVYLKTANGKKYIARFLVIATWRDDILILKTQQTGIKPEDW
ncbi:MAG: hypothetical protein WB799_24240 [Candidatus Sulfotelmatobacter sp.]